MGAVCGRWHEPVAGQAFLCSHGPSAVPHAGTVFAVVAQLAEQRPRNAQVTGPNPVDGSMTQSILDGISLVGAKERNRYGKHQPQTYRSYP